MRVAEESVAEESAAEWAVVESAAADSAAAESAAAMVVYLEAVEREVYLVEEAMEAVQYPHRNTDGVLVHRWPSIRWSRCHDRRWPRAARTGTYQCLA